MGLAGGRGVRTPSLEQRFLKSLRAQIQTGRGKVHTQSKTECGCRTMATAVRHTPSLTHTYSDIETRHEGRHRSVAGH